MLTLGIFDALSKNVLQAFYGLMLILDGFIYGLIASLYEVFTIIASAKIFSNKIFVDITNRVYAVIGVVMLFFLAYSLLRAIINPDNFASDKKGIGKIVPNIVISIILIAIVPTLFTYAYKIQNVILENNLIGNIVLGKDNQDYEDQIIKNYTITYTDSNGTKQTTTEQTNITSTDVSKGYIKYGGTGMAQIIFESFFYRNEGYKNEDTEVSGSVLKTMGFGALTAGGLACSIGIGVAAATGHITFGIGAVVGIGACLVGSFISGSAMSSQLDLLSQGSYTLLDVQRLAATTGDFSLYSIFAADDLISDGVIHYSWFLSTAAGIFVCYILLSFCLDLGVRAIKLGYYQIISPIPILANVLPAGKKIFDNWVKGTLSTFAGVFIRVFIIFLVVFIIQELPMITETNWWTSSGFSSTSGVVRLLARTAIILGLLMFAKQAPKLISDMFGLKDGDMKLGIKDKLMSAAAPAAATGAAITTGVRNWNASKGRNPLARVGSTIAGAGSGFVRGFKGAKDAKTFKDIKTAAGKAAADATNKRDMRALYKAEHDEVALGHIQDFWDSSKKWAGVGISTNDYARLKGLEKQLEAEKKIEDARKAVWDAAGTVIDQNNQDIKIGWDRDTLMGKLEFSDAEMTAVFGTPTNGFENITLKQLKDLKETKVGFDGRNLNFYQVDAIDRAIKKRTGELRQDIISGKSGITTDGKWTTDAAAVDFTKTIGSHLGELQKTIHNLYKELGANNEIFSKPENRDIRAFTYGTDVIDLSKNPQTQPPGKVQITDSDGKVIDFSELGKIVKNQKSQIQTQKAKDSSEMSALRMKIQENQNKDKDKK